MVDGFGGIGDTFDLKVPPTIISAPYNQHYSTS
jgi:hypothetical protein